MKRFVPILLTCVLFGEFSYAKPSHAWTHGGAVAGPCAYGAYTNSSGVSDGCSGAPTNGSFVYANFPNSAKQSGQIWLASHPQAWNVAGVDYRVGYDTTLTLKDPAVASLPTNCSYSATGRFTGGPEVECNAAASPTFNGFNFGAIGAHGATLLVFDSNVTGTCTVTNNKFAWNATFAGQAGQVIFVNGSAGCVRDVEDNEFAGAWPGVNNKNQGDGIADNFTAAATYKYNYFHNMTERPLTARFDGGVVYRYNVVDTVDMTSVAGAAHGEVWTAFSGVTNLTFGTMNSDFNVVVIPSNTPSAAWSAPFFLGDNYNQTAPLVTINNNTLVGNLAGGQGGTYTDGAAIVMTQYAKITTLTMNDNYVDPTGALYCVLNNVAATSISGSNSGTTITITAIGVPGAAAIIPGAWLFSAGITPTQISAYGTGGTTGTGLTGTYVGSVSQTNGPWTTVKENTAIGTLNFNTNKNLIDGSAITTSGYDLSSGTCTGHS